MLAEGIVVSAAAVKLGVAGFDLQQPGTATLSVADYAPEKGTGGGGQQGAQSVERTRHTLASFRMTQLVGSVLRQAGLDKRPGHAADFGIVSGSHYGCAKVYELHQRLRQLGPRGIDAVYFAQATHSYPLSVCAIEYGFKGPCAALVGFHCAGIEALLCARDWLQDRRCRHVIVVAYEDISGPVLDHVRSIDREGRVQEAMAVLCLERLDAAVARGAPFLAELKDIEFLSAAENTESNVFLGASGIVDLSLRLTGEQPKSPHETVEISVVDPDAGGLRATFSVHGKVSSPCAM